MSRKKRAEEEARTRAAAQAAVAVDLEDAGRYLAGIEFEEDDFEFMYAADDVVMDANFAYQGFWKDALTRFRKNKSAIFGLIDGIACCK